MPEKQTKITPEQTKTSITEERITECLTLQKYAKTIARKEFFYNIMSPQVNELVKAMTEFKKVMPELKTDKAAGGRYKYQSLPALLNAVATPLAKAGCTLMQPVQTIGPTTYVITMIMHTSGQYVRSVTAIPEQYAMAGKLVSTSENLQAMGGAITYTKRHTLKAILGIDADEDTDAGAATTYSSRNNYGNQ